LRKKQKNKKKNKTKIKEGNVNGAEKGNIEFTVNCPP
jgi:hypothetical protein